MNGILALPVLKINKRENSPQAILIFFQKEEKLSDVKWFWQFSPRKKKQEVENSSLMKVISTALLNLSFQPVLLSNSLTHPEICPNFSQPI